MGDPLTRPTVPHVNLDNVEAIREAFKKAGSAGSMLKNVMRTLEIFCEAIIPAGSEDRKKFDEAIIVLKRLILIWIGLSL